MNNTKYLYGASVQGIQQFIFSTDKLREISGASEIVEFICKGFLKKRLKELGSYQEDNLLLGAAGNIKYIFDSREACEHFVYDFPRKVMEMAPGITISQAVLPLEEGLRGDSLQKLEDLLKAQRNKQVAQHGTGWMISERSRKTGAPARHMVGKDRISEAQFKKSKKAEESSQLLLEKILGQANIPGDILSYEMEDLLERKERGWIAVVHADGNNLGKKIIELSKQVKESSIHNAFSEMSKRLECATVAAAQKAFRTLCWKGNTKLPIRPVVLGGDDMTIIMDGRYAIEFTQCFLKAFEEETRQQLSGFKEEFGVDIFGNGLTACAGIAFVKPKYPFHYAVRLSENLCERAKKVSKKSEGAPSCLLFHKVHSSFLEEYGAIVERELTAGNVQFDFGPYFSQANKAPNGYSTTAQLLQWVQCVNEPNAPAAPLRVWLNDLKVNRERADQVMARIQDLNKNYIAKLSLKEWRQQRNGNTYTHLYDVIQLANITK